MAGSDLQPATGRWWQLAPVLRTLLDELCSAFPAVPRAAFGTIGDADHQARKSDHNPDHYGYVRALDVPKIEHDGPPLDLLAAFLREVGATQSQRLAQGGYVIWNRRKASAASQWKWVTYLGVNPHTEHLHVSCSSLPHFYKLEHPWKVERWLSAHA